MESLLARRLIVVTGKGGVGKTTISAAIGMIAARRGARTIIAEVGGTSSRLSELFGTRPPEPGVPSRLTAGLWSLSIDPEIALLEWMQSLAGRLPARLLASKASFQYFAAAAPGAKELVAMVKVWRLIDDVEQRSRDDRRGGSTTGDEGDRGGRDSGQAGSGESDQLYDLVVLDAPATGHALAMLDSPQTIGSIARVGPVADQANAVRNLLKDRSRTGYVAVARSTEMAITETIDLRQELTERLAVEPDAVILNATVQRRFNAQELARIAALRRNGGPQENGDDRPAGAETAGADATSTQTAGAETAGAETAGAETASAEAGGAEAGGPETADGETAAGSDVEISDSAATDAAARVTDAAATAAAAIAYAGRRQSSQAARLRRLGMRVLQAPFIFQPDLDLAALEQIARRLDGKI